MEDLFLTPAQNLAAILPCYTAYGDQTLLLYTDGRTALTELHIRTVIRKLARQNATDLTVLRQHSTQSTGCAILQPLPLASGLLLLPVKIRRPRLTGDSSSGYINYYTVTAFLSKRALPHQSQLELKGGHHVDCIWTACTVEDHLRRARLSGDGSVPIRQGSHLDTPPPASAPPLSSGTSLALWNRLAGVLEAVLSGK